MKLRFAIFFAAAMAMTATRATTVSDSGAFTGTLTAQGMGLVSDHYAIEVPDGKKAVITVNIDKLAASQCGSKYSYAEWNCSAWAVVYEEKKMYRMGESSTKTFFSNGTLTVGAWCEVGTYTEYLIQTLYGGVLGPHTERVPIKKQYSSCSYKVDYTVTARYSDLLPDLSVSSLSLSSPTAPTDETSTLLYTIKNIGDKEAGATTAYIYDGDANIGAIAVGSLVAGASETGAFALPQLEPGVHEIKVVSDTEGVVAEANENNNESAVSLLVYERVPYWIRFHPNGGNGTMSDQRHVAGTEQALSGNAFSRTDHVFAGWATTPDGAVEYTDAEIVKALTYIRNDLVILYAVWKPLRHEVTFDANGGECEEESRLYSAADKCAYLPYACLEDHDFAGWFTEPVGGVRVCEDSVIKSDCALYAHYERTVQILQFDPNGGTGSMPNVTTYGGLPAKLPKNRFVNPGYHFSGWSAYAEGPVVLCDEVVITGGDPVKLYGRWNTGTITLYAKWDADHSTRYSFYANDGDGCMPDVVVTNNSLELPECTFTREGYAFTGWKNGHVDYGNADESWYEVWACWERVMPINYVGTCQGVEFCSKIFWGYEWKASVDDNGDDCISIVDNYISPDYKDGVQLYCRTAAHGVLAFRYEDGIHYRSQASGTRYVRIDGKYHYEFEKDKVYFHELGRDTYVKWEQFAELYCSDMYAGLYDEVVARIYPICFIQTEYELPAESVETNIVLSAGTDWIADPGCDWIVVQKDPDDPHRGIVKISANDTLYPRSATITINDGYGYPVTIGQSVGIATADIFFDAQGGTMETNFVRHASGGAFGELPEPERYGYSFVGWFTQPKEGGTRINAESTVGQMAQTVYARWGLVQHAIEFDVNGGAGIVPSKNVLFGGLLGELPTTTLDGYDFAGWTTQKGRGAMIGAGSLANGDATLHAYWTLTGSSPLSVTHGVADDFKVTFGKNGGTGGSDSVQATKGQPMPAATAPTKSGYVFEGYWTTTGTGGVCYYDGSMKSVRNWDKTGNVTLWAKWTKAVSVKVTFGKNGGTGGDAYVTATTGKPMPTPRTAPTQSGWTFAGYWDTLAMDEKGNAKGKQYYDASMKSVRAWDKPSATTLWAKWTNKVTLGKNGGTGGDSYVTCTKGQPMPKRTMPTKSGYVFDGYWTTTGAGGVKYYNADGTSAHAWDKGGSVTLWAKWVAAVSCKVTFGKNGGTGGDNYVTATTGKAMPTPRTAPTLKGWSFGGYWDTLACDAKGNPLGKQYYNSKMESVRAWDKTTATTLWAKWTVKVTLGKNGGTGGDSTVTVIKGQPFPKRTMPTKSGYTFGGYFVSASSKTGQCYNPDGTGTSSMKWTTGGTPTIWALWTKAAGCVELPASPAAPASLTSGLYSGVLADGSGAFYLMLDEAEEGGVRTAFLYIASEDGSLTAECTAEEVDGILLLTTEDGDTYLLDIATGSLGFGKIFR